MLLDSLFMTVDEPRTEFWTSSEVAKALGVGVSSIKRWTDEGVLKSTKTLGNHRRYSLLSIHSFAESRGLPTENLPPIDQAPELDLEGIDLQEIEERFLSLLVQGETGQARRLIVPLLLSIENKSAAMDHIFAGAMREIGEKWKRGEIDVEREHRASYAVEGILENIRPSRLTGDRKALLACPPGESHDLPLRMVRVALEWQSWRTEYLGANLPWRSLRVAIRDVRPEIVLMSSRSPVPFSSPDFEQIVEMCQRSGVEIGVGGEWARGGSGKRQTFHRFRTLGGFEKWLRTFEPTPLAAGQSFG